MNSLNYLRSIIFVFLSSMSFWSFGQQKEENWELSISQDGLRIQRADGTDWFWLADTGWSVFQELNQEDAHYYFRTRASQGFTVIQAVAVMGWSREWNDVNAYGEVPFVGGDCTRPNEKYWSHVDWLINTAKEYGLYVAILPAWGSYWGVEATSDYAQWITNRYQSFENIIWVNGGDREVGNEAGMYNEFGEIFNQDEDALITFHPRYRDPSSHHFHNKDWLDFNMQQSSHKFRDLRADDQVDEDLMRTPTKPTLNGEPNYEDHCVAWKQQCAEGVFNAHDVRQLAYWTVLAGAAGYTYGHVHVWDFYNGGNKEDGLEDWKKEVLDSGAVQMKYLMDLMMSRPHIGRKPAQYLFGNNVTDGVKKPRALMGNGYAFIYVAQGENIIINSQKIPWRNSLGWWYNPRTGNSEVVIINSELDLIELDPPGESEGDNDWVLVIDNEAYHYSQPGHSRLK